MGSSSGRTNSTRAATRDEADALTMNSAMRDAGGASRGTDEPAAPIRRS
jgi:hypothetical protein